MPPEIRDAAPSALEFVARALHRTIDRLDERDRFALAACAEDASLLTSSTSGADRVVLMRGIARLRGLDLGDQTDLTTGGGDGGPGLGEAGGVELGAVRVGLVGVGVAELV